MPYEPKNGEPKNLGEALDLLESIAMFIENDETIHAPMNTALELHELSEKARAVVRKNRKFYSNMGEA